MKSNSTYIGKKYCYTIKESNKSHKNKMFPNAESDYWDFKK